MINVLVYRLKFRSKKRGTLKPLETQKAGLLISQTVQRESFADLISKLEDYKKEKVNQDLAKLPPFLDSDNTIDQRNIL